LLVGRKLLMPLKVRRAAVEDAASIARVQIASWQAAYRSQVSDEFLDALDHAERVEIWRRILGSSEGDTLVAEREGVLVGFCHMRPSRDSDASETELEVTAIYVDPSWWNHGYGLNLMQEALRAASARLGAVVSLWVLRSNHGARAFYEAIGFATDGVTRSEAMAGGPALEQVRYRLVLN